MACISFGVRPLVLALCGLWVGVAGAQDLTVALPEGRTALAEIGLYEVHWQSYGKDAVAMPTSWMGHFDEVTGISYTPQGRVLGREALLIHSPWRVPMGRTWVTYHLALPEARPIRLRFGIAMAPDAVLPGKSDGATFSCQVISEGKAARLLGEHYAKGEWKDVELDLSAYAGKRIGLELQVEPGPKNNAAFDYSYFGDAEIVVGEAADRSAQQFAAYTATKAYAATRDADLRRLGNDPARGILPGNLLPHRNTLAQEGEAWVFAYAAEDGRVVYRYTPKTGTLEDFTAQINDGRPFAVAAFGGVMSADRQLMQGGALKSLRRVRDALEVVWDYGAVEVTWTFGIAGKALTVRASSASVGIAGLDLGAVAVDLRRPVVIPYLKGQAFYLPGQGAFACRYLDWTQSHASACPQGVAQYTPRTDGVRNPLHEVGYIAVSPVLGEVLPSIPHPPSPYLSTLAGRVMLDVWGHHKGTYAGDAENLRTLKEWGVDHLAIITHQWQRWGYDVKLPDHIPADPVYGGEEGMELLGRTAKELGYLWSLHENYIDLYPDAPSFDPKAQVLTREGKPSPAWYNRWSKVQSFGLKSNRALDFARANSPEIHRRYGTTAAYLDVHTCVPPWHQLDHDATQPMAAMALAKVQNDTRLFQYECDTHGGPLFGEGANHFYWAGRCDGVEAQVEGGEDHVPLLEFDLLKIHPQMVNHGMGYYERWFRGGREARWGVDVANLEQIDKYRAQELAYGHAGFVGANAVANPWWVAREHHLMHPVQRLYGAARATAIEYEVNGRLVPVSAALIAGETRRQRTAYDSGLQVWVNWRPEVWTVEAGGQRYELPQWGFLALGPQTQVMTYLSNGRVFDYAQCPEYLFADARTWTDMPYTAARADVEPRLRAFEYLGDDRVRITYEWIVKEAIRPDLQCFVHGVNAQAARPDGIVFQQDHKLPKPTTAWRAGETIVDGPYEVRVPATHGTYDMRIGLYNQQMRLQMAGKDDGTRRYTLATLHLERKDGRITRITAERPAEVTKAPERIDFGARTNPAGTWTSFGPLATDGAVKVQREANRLTLIPYPRESAVKVRLDLAAMAGAAQDTAVEVRAVLLPAKGDPVAIPFSYARGQLSLELNRPGASRYIITWR